MNKQIQLHKQKMKQIYEEAQTSTGYRKKDLMRKYRKMQKELSECMMYLKKR